MREYRAKTTKKENREHAFNNVWVEGDLIKNKDKYYIHPHGNIFKVENELAKLMIAHEVIPETVGQFTGLTDKNHKKIFEGDIVKAKDILHNGQVQIKGEVYQVIFSDRGYFCASNNAWWEFIDELGNIEVIGNITDNPELLEVQNER